ncbi:hypothetical protein CRUP_023829 [Coryphaenoides rupestris]|nr:hypothetical protein CRUP_023829 [Coryphaenoides rupestris]
MALVNGGRCSQRGPDKTRTYSWAQHPGGAADPGYPGAGVGGALYGRLCYSSHTLPFEAGAAELGYRIPGGGGADHSLVIQNQAAMVGAMESGAVYISPTELGGGGGGGGGASRAGSRVSTSDGGTPRTNDSHERGGGGAGGGGGSCTTESSGEEKMMNGHCQEGDWPHR